MGAGNFNNMHTIHAAMRIAQNSSRRSGGGGFKPEEPKKEPRRQECSVCGHQNIIKEEEISDIVQKESPRFTWEGVLFGLVGGFVIAAIVLWLFHS